MFSTILNLHVICFILIQIKFLNVAGDEFPSLYNGATNNRSQSQAPRSKRSLHANMPITLKIRIKYGMEEAIDLNWMKKSQHLANDYLPVTTRENILNKNVMKDIGEFVVYHDNEKCSSVVYFEKFNAFFGNIGMDYSLTNLPYKFDAFGIYLEDVGAPYIMKRISTPAHNLLVFPDMNIVTSSNGDSVSHINKRPSDSGPGPGSKHQRIKRDFDGENNVEVTNSNVSEISNIRKRRWNPLQQEYYLETLIFITRDIAEIFKKAYNDDHYIQWIVRYCIIRFNAVDMLFQKLKKTDLRLLINIAKIVIEDNLAPSHFINSAEAQFTETVVALRQYLHVHQLVYTQDSFDHVFIITSLPIKDKSMSVPAMTDYAADLYQARKHGLFYDAVPITVMGYATHYVAAVHEISRVLNIKIDLLIERSNNEEQCWSIMQEGSSKCDNCLTWSAQSKNQFLEFFRNNRNRCFLLNSPRSLRPFRPSRYLTPHKQCQCFGFKSYTRNYRGEPLPNIRTGACNVPLQCKRTLTSKCSENTIRPLDGTICGRNMVCWGGECTHSSFGSR